MRKRWNSLVSALILASAAAGCGGGGAGNDVASLSGNGSSTTTATGDKASRDEAFLAFARCMREHGVDMPDPDTSGGGGGVVRVAPGAGDGAASAAAAAPAFGAAEAACRHHLKDAMPQDLSPEDRQKMQDGALAFAKCMREHGIDMPDPIFGEGGAIQQVIGPGGALDDPAFQRAQEACKDHMPIGRVGATEIGVAGEGEGP